MKILDDPNLLIHWTLPPNPSPVGAVQLQMDLETQEAVPVSNVWRLLSQGQKQAVLQALVKFVKVLVVEPFTVEVERPLEIEPH